jgi:membrane protein
MTTSGATEQQQQPQRGENAPAPRNQKSDENAPAAPSPGPTGVRGFLRLLWQTIFKFFGDGCPSLAAALSFYTFFSLPALLALLLTLLGSMVDPVQVQSAVVDQVGGVIGKSGADQVATIIARSQRPAGGSGASLGTWLSLVVLAFGATTAFAALQGALNKVWGVKPDPRRNQLKVFLVKRVFSFGVVITVAFLLLVSLAVSTALAAIGQRLAGHAASSAALLEIVTSVASFAVSAGLFAVMFRYLPDARIAWRDVRAGAIGAAVLFVLGKTVIGLYLGGTNPGNAYGAAGSLAVVLIWVYYTSMILLLGAEFTEEWARHYGRGIIPERGAVAYVEEERAVKTG